MDRLLTLQYYFTQRPDPNFQYTKLTVGIIIALLLGSLFLHWFRKKQLKDPITKKIIRKVPTQLRNFGSILLLLLVFRESGIPYLSMRIWWFLWAALALYTAIKFMIGFKKDYNKRAERHKKNISKNKYFKKKR